MVYRPEKTIGNEHQKFTTMDKYKAKQKPDIMQVADISQRDIDLSDKRGYSKLDLDTARTLSGNPTLTQKELEQLKKVAKDKQELEPTGIFAK